MASITPGQCRAARALLGWSQRDLEKRAKVSRKAIADFEREASAPYQRTLRDIIETLEAAGIVFQSPQDGVIGVGVALKWGVDTKLNLGGEDKVANNQGSGVSTAPWDDDFEDFANDQLAAPYIIPISDGDRAILRQRFAECPDAWNKLSDRAKAVYRRELNM